MRIALQPIPASAAILRKVEEKHGVAFEEVEEVFRRSHAVFRGPWDQYGERRYTSLGMTTTGRALLVIYTIPRPGVAKVITAREMTKAELRRYRRWKGS